MKTKNLDKQKRKIPQCIGMIKSFVENKKSYIVLGVLFIIPLVVGLLYAIPIPQIIMVDAADLLSYYGTVFGILGSFIIYQHEVSKKENDCIKKIRPVFIVEVEKVDIEQDIFNIKITNIFNCVITYFYFYDRFVEEKARKQYSIKTVFNKTVEEEEYIDFDYNITNNPDILDTDGFPKYVHLMCDDADGNFWSLSYYKLKDGNRIYYYPREREISQNKIIDRITK